MKKTAILLVLIMYGTFSFGMSIHFHYCCGKLKSVDLTDSKNEQSCGAGKTHQMGSKPCCENKKLELKFTGEQSPAKASYPAFFPGAHFPVQQEFFNCSPFQTKKLLPETFAPPPNISFALYILHGVFRI